MKTKILTLIAASVAVLNVAAIAGPGFQDFPRRVETKTEAMDCCKAGAKVALACKDCKTVEVAKDENAVVGWFSKDTTHGCSGCGGKISLSQPGSGKAGTIATSKHVCSKCGENSPYVCTDHKKA